VTLVEAAAQDGSCSCHGGKKLGQLEGCTSVMDAAKGAEDLSSSVLFADF
jgi:hypothetical protein